MKRKITLIIVFIMGIGIFSFPLFSNWYNNRVMFTLVENYQEYVGGLSIEEVEKRLEAAHTFNQALVTGDAVYHDPFTNKVSNYGDASVYPDGFEFSQTIGSIEIPIIDVDLPIVFGVADRILSHAIGYLPNTSLPVGGESSHTVLTGHRGLATAELFHHLDEVSIGDTFYIHVLDETLAYEVDQIKRVKPYEVEDLAIEVGKDLATLITCDPYMINTHRLLVRGHRVPYVPESELKQKDMFIERYKEYIIAVCLVGVVSGGGIYLKRRKGGERHE